MSGSTPLPSPEFSALSNPSLKLVSNVGAGAAALTVPGKFQQHLQALQGAWQCQAAPTDDKPPGAAKNPVTPGSRWLASCASLAAAPGLASLRVLAAVALPAQGRQHTLVHPQSSTSPTCRRCHMRHCCSHVAGRTTPDWGRQPRLSGVLLLQIPEPLPLNQQLQGSHVGIPSQLGDAGGNQHHGGCGSETWSVMCTNPVPAQTPCG